MKGPRCSRHGCPQGGIWRATLVALQRSGGDLDELRVTLPLVVCARHKRHALRLLLENARARAAIDLRLTTRGRPPLDWSLARIEFARVH